MKKTLCFYFQIHQPVRLRRYRFFDIGKRHDYFDEYVNRSTIRRITEKCYLPMNHLIMDLIKRYGTNFKVSFSISGSALEQFALHAPEVIESFRNWQRPVAWSFWPRRTPILWHPCLIPMNSRDKYSDIQLEWKSCSGRNR